MDTGFSLNKVDHALNPSELRILRVKKMNRESMDKKKLLAG
jgi:hypothetical protein